MLRYHYCCGKYKGQRKSVWADIVKNCMTEQKGLGRGVDDCDVSGLLDIVSKGNDTVRDGIEYGVNMVVFLIIIY